MRSRLRRTTALLLVVAALVAGACTDAGELGGPAVGGTAAARIGTLLVTNADLEAEVEHWALSPAFLAGIDPVGMAEIGAPGRRTTALTSFVLSHRIISEQARILATANGYAPDDAEIGQIIDQLQQSFGPPFAALDPEFQRTLATDLAYQGNLQSLPPDLQPVAVAVNPRYGSTVDVGNGLVQVEPPTGPVPVLAVA